MEQGKIENIVPIECIWRDDPREENYFFTSCGAWGDRGLDFLYCPYCGGSIVEKEALANE